MTRAPRIPLTRPCFDGAELRNLRRVLASGWLVEGPFTARFREQVRRVTGARFVIPVPNATIALYCVLRGLGIGPGDEVVVPAFTYVATANAAVLAGATVRFADIRLDDYTVDPVSLCAALSRRTRAVITVDLFGAPADYRRIAPLLRQRGIPLIADAACALGTCYRGRPVGTLAQATCFSLHPRKNITTGEGGIITTDDARLAGWLEQFRNHGAAAYPVNAAPDAMPDHDLPGFNFRFNDLLAAVGCAQMEKLGAVIRGRRRAAARYDRLLAPLTGVIALPAARPDTVHIYQSYTIRIRNGRGGVARATAFRDALVRHLQRAGIQTRPATQCVPDLAFYRALPRRARCPHAHAAMLTTISLPLWAGMPLRVQRDVAAALQAAVAGA